MASSGLVRHVAFFRKDRWKIAEQAPMMAGVFVGVGRANTLRVGSVWAKGLLGAEG